MILEAAAPAESIGFSVGRFRALKTPPSCASGLGDRAERLRLFAIVRTRLTALDEEAGEEGETPISSDVKDAVLHLVSHAWPYLQPLIPAIFPRPSGGAAVVYHNRGNGRRLEIRIGHDGDQYFVNKVEGAEFRNEPDEKIDLSILKNYFSWVSDPSLEAPWPTTSGV